MKTLRGGALALVVAILLTPFAAVAPAVADHTAPNTTVTASQAVVTDGVTISGTVAQGENADRTLALTLNGPSGVATRNIVIPAATPNYSVSLTRDELIPLGAGIVAVDAVATNSYGERRFAATSFLFNPAPVITVQPRGNEVGEGTPTPARTHTARFTSTATAAGPLTGQWQVARSASPAIWENLVGETTTGTDSVTSTLEVLRERAEYDDRYRIVWSNAIGQTVSNEVSVTVHYVEVLTGADDVSVTEGEPASFTITSDPNGAGVQWFVSVDGETFTAIDDATDQTYTIDSTSLEQNGNLYRAEAYVAGEVSTSRTALLTVNAVLTVITQPTDQSVFSGGQAVFSAESSYPDATAQWERDSGSGFLPVVGATSKEYSFTATLADDGDQVRAVFTNALGATATTNAASLLVIPAPVITVQPRGNEVGEGTPTPPRTHTARFTSTATAAGPLTGQWQVARSASPAIWENLADQTATGSDSVTSTLEVLRERPEYDDRYRIIWSNASGQTVSTEVSVTVHYVEVLTGADDVSVTEGEPASFSITSDPNGADVQWFVSVDGDTFTPIENATDQTYTIDSTSLEQNGNLYRAEASVAGQVSTSRTALLTVNAVLTVTTQPTDQSVSDGDQVTFSAESSDPNATVQWERDSGSGFLPVPGETSNDYTFAATLEGDGDQVRAVFTNAAGAAVTTNAATLFVTAVPVGATPSAPLTFTATQTGPNQVTVTWTPPVDQGGTPITSYLVGYSQGESGNGQEVDADVRTFVFNDLQPGQYTFSVRAVNEAGFGDAATQELQVLAADVTDPSPVATPPVVVPDEDGDDDGSEGTEVAGSNDLPDTGADLAIVALAGMALAGVGGMLILGARRRRTV